MALSKNIPDLNKKIHRQIVDSLLEMQKEKEHANMNKTDTFTIRLGAHFAPMVEQGLLEELHKKQKENTLCWGHADISIEGDKNLPPDGYEFFLNDEKIGSSNTCRIPLEPPESANVSFAVHLDLLLIKRMLKNKPEDDVDAKEEYEDEETEKFKKLQAKITPEMRKKAGELARFIRENEDDLRKELSKRREMEASEND